MRTLIIDRFEGNYAICEELSEGEVLRKEKKKELHLYGIARAELPVPAKEGDVLCISDDGNISVDEEQTRVRREKMIEKQRLISK